MPMNERTATVETVTIEEPVRPGREVATTAGRAITQTLDMISLALADRKVEPAYLRELIAVQREYIAMQREIEADEARVAFNEALQAAQADMPRVTKNGVIDLGKGKPMPFAKWEDVDTVLRPIQARHGFSVTFSEVAVGEFGVTWEATHRHVRGYSQANRITLARDSGPGRNAVQASGSTSSYAKRYLVENFFNIVREGIDDDGKRGGDHFLTQEQVAQLEALLKETKTEESVFCERGLGDGIRSLDEIPDHKFETAYNMLMRKKQKMAEGGAKP